MDRDVGKELGGAPGGQPYRRGYAASGTAKSSALTNPFKAAKSRTLLAGGGHPGGYKRMTGDGIVRDLSRHRPSLRKSPLHSRAGPTFRWRVTGKPQQLHRRRRRRRQAPAGLGGRRQIPGTLVVGETAAEFVAAGCRFLYEHAGS